MNQKEKKYFNLKAILYHSLQSQLLQLILNSSVLRLLAITQDQLLQLIKKLQYQMMLNQKTEDMLHIKQLTCIKNITKYFGQNYITILENLNSWRHF